MEYRPVARIFAWGGGGGGGAYERLRREMASAAGASPKRDPGVFSPRNFEKVGYLRPHFVRFEDSLLGKEPYKGEGGKNNNSGTFLNSKRRFRNRIL